MGCMNLVTVISRYARVPITLTHFTSLQSFPLSHIRLGIYMIDGEMGTILSVARLQDLIVGNLIHSYHFPATSPSYLTSRGIQGSIPGDPLPSLAWYWPNKKGPALPLLNPLKLTPNHNISCTIDNLARCSFGTLTCEMYAELASPQCFYQGTSIPLTVAIDLAPIWKLWSTKFSASNPCCFKGQTIQNALGGIDLTAAQPSNLACSITGPHFNTDKDYLQLVCPYQTTLPLWVLKNYSHCRSFTCGCGQSHISALDGKIHIWQQFRIVFLTPTPTQPNPTPLGVLRNVSMTLHEAEEIMELCHQSMEATLLVVM